MGRLILDTGVLVAAVRGRFDLTELGEQDDIALPAVVLAEYLTGVELDDDPSRQAAQRAFLDDLLSITPVVAYTEQVAVHHATLLAHVRRSGRPRGAHELIIAATARAGGRTLITTDVRAGFDELPEVDVRVVVAG